MQALRNTTQGSAPALYGASLLSGALLVAAWPDNGFTPLLALAFLPLFWLSDQNASPKTKWAALFLAHLVWNAGTTWWMWNSTQVGAVAAILANSTLMLLPWALKAWVHKKGGASLALWGFVFFWMGFEWLHLNWEISWPWLSLGNAFAQHPQWVHWYDTTGIAGGSLWVLVQNALGYQWLQTFQNKTSPSARHWRPLAAFVLLPVLLLSWSASKKIPDTPAAPVSTNVVVVQPNIDPYQKFEVANAAAQLDLLLSLSQSALDSQTRLLVWPETALSVAEWQDQVGLNPYYQKVFQFLAQHPQLHLLSGIESFKNHGNSTHSATARRMDNGQYYDVYNAAVWATAGKPLQFYNKSKLVPGVESLPSFLRWLSPVFEQFGGSTGGYGRNDSAMVFADSQQPYRVTPAICYESIYGSYLAEFTRKGAGLMAIMTNDGWWGNTPGHRQHLAYARLRAIENHQWVVRSANTGISAIINPQGQVVQSLGWNQAGTLKFAVPPSVPALTLYARWGDWLYALGSALGALVLLFTLAQSLRHAKK